ncbi:probable multidrug resistance-associated protein lethal(2)03659 [Condylostylus longicornis]|uniref:probable multidrug resistance-associated protein lethal(2)03659 n=1 Tax=Condylostylus longicornis TaxID=2530218 RepID=UPI00244E532B|nr:probable multidrug resistance-associated protein lethal(2)03659 [Condylostylus longicornis]XP_055375265.1 probable multidrug resistance-associated protein lethal(2)03659 [Condylostylus longicornis]
MESGYSKTYENLPRNPREKANIFSFLCFGYTLPIFWKGRKKDLDEKDLYKALDEHKSEILGDKLSKAWEKQLDEQIKSGKKPSLLKACLNVFGLKLMALGIVLFCLEFGLKLTQPYLLGRLIEFYSKGTTGDMTDAYIFAAAVIITCALSVLIMHPFMFGTLHLGMKIRLAMCSVIYRKALRLSKTALGDTTAGQVVNLLSNDVGRLDLSIIFVHFLWIGPLEVILITYLMWIEIDYGAFTGVAFMLAFIPLQAYMGKKTSTLRLKTALRTDERVRLMNEIIQGIQVIKMYTWEKPFAKMVEYCRRKEINCITKTSYIRGVLLSFIMFLTRVSIFMSLATYALLYRCIDAQTAFVITAYYNILRPTMTVFFPQGIGQMAETLVSIKRIQKFLQYDETEIIRQENFKSDKSFSNNSTVNQTQTSSNHSTVTNNSDENAVQSQSTDIVDIDNVAIKNGPTKNAILSEAGVDISHVKAKWDTLSNELTLDDVSLRVQPGTLVAIIGPVGAGKSSLIQTILGELPIDDGKININGTISYASQEPWLFTGTVRQNILFGLPMDRKRYKTVVKKCALERDFELFPYGDKTIVGERGASLSGGQKARISLARAVYRRCSIYLLDDPLSAVDTHVGRHLFDECMRDFLRENIVILVTHQLQFIQHADQIVILDHGKVKAVGSYDTLRESGLDFAELLEAPEEEEVKRRMSVSKLRLRQNSETSINSLEEPDPEHNQMQVAEMHQKGGIGLKLYGKYFKAGGGIFYVSFMLSICVLAQIFASGGDWFLSYWVKEAAGPAQFSQPGYFGSANDSHDAVNNMYNATLENNIKSALNTSHFDNSTGYINKLESEGVLPKLLKALGSTEEDTNTIAVYIFSGITIGTILITLFRSFLFFNVAMKASTNLHNQMFRGITRATMYFFNTNPSGRILNRFSKDMGQVDEILPSVMIDVIQIFLQLFGIVIVVAIINPYFLIPTVLMGLIFYLLRNFYLKTSRNVKRVEAITRSPIYSHLAATLSGLSTIRCFNAQEVLKKEFDNYQDMHSSAFFMFIATSRAFGFWLDCFCVIYIAIVTLSFFLFGGNGGNVGLAITQAMGLTGMVQWGMRQSAELENTMTSVERVVEYESIDPEPPLESDPDKKPPPDWPQEAHIKFDNLSLRYFPDEKSEYVLKSLEFEILPKEKVGIVGRTGAGKSSLINALFRLSYNDGKIEIDGRDTNQLGLHDLRSKISIIPQEPVLFSGTMRYNLDPFNEYSDEKLWAALEEVKLKQAVSELLHGLQSKISEGGANFSVGQRQLVCLARAILRENKILVMDEATANVDPQTDFLIQATIRTKFADCTVLTIAHRLHTVMDSDKVLVMDAGHVVEFGHPYKLLTDSKPKVFYGMVQQTGKSTFDTLFKTAEKAYKSKTE